MMEFLGNLWQKVKPFLCKIIKTARCCGCLVLQKNKQFTSAILWIFIAACFACLLWVLNSEGIPQELKQAIGDTEKREIIRLIGWGMGGLLAAIVALALNRRAEEMAENNKLIEQGHINERFKSATESLASDKVSVRIASFYQFYYLVVKVKNDKSFRKSIFDILCAHLRYTTSIEKYRTEKGKDKPTEEIQSLLDVMFKREKENPFAGIKADLRSVYLVGASLEDANLQSAVFQEAVLSGAYFEGANLQDARFMGMNPQVSVGWVNNMNMNQTRFINAKLQGAIFHTVDLKFADFDYAKLQGTVFFEVENIHSANFRAIEWDEETKFPSNITFTDKKGKEYKTDSVGKPEEVPKKVPEEG